jgi:hypothetical protein
MSKRLSAEDILPLVVCLTARERSRLLKLIVGRPGTNDKELYGALPPTLAEFSSDEEALAWDSDGWEGVS